MTGGTAKLVPKEMQGKSLTASIAKQAAIKANAIQRRNRQEVNIVKEWYSGISV